MKKTVTDYPNIEVGIQDLKMITYFIFMKYKYDTSHRQGTSSKSDLIGGFMDRWVNRISEFVIFNNFLKGKGYRIASDYFLYDNKTKIIIRKKKISAKTRNLNERTKCAFPAYYRPSAKMF